MDLPLADVRRRFLSSETTVKTLLACGVISSVLYVATDVLAAMRWEGYSYRDSMVSQLFAIGTPTRAFIVPLMTAYNLLVIAFGIGVLASVNRRPALRITGWLFIAYGIVSFAGLMLPLHYSGGEVSGGGVAHATVTFALVLLMLLFIGFGSAADGRWFRAYSIATIVAVVAGGALSGAQGARLAAHEATPWLGVTERANIFLSLLWVGVFAAILLRNHTHQGETH